MSFIGKTLGKIVGHQAKSQPQQQQPQTANNSPSSSSQASNASNTSGQVAGNHASSSSSSQHHHHHSFLFASKHHSSASGGATSSNDSHLTLTHLRKVFYEYMHPKHPDANQPNRDDKLYQILPLFIKVWFLKFFS